MIIKAKSRTGGKALGDYLLSEGRYAKNADKNEYIEIWEGLGVEHGLMLQTLLQGWQISAERTDCQKPLYHMQMRTGDGEALTREQWLYAVNTLTDRLGLDGHDRAIVAHTMDGHQHVHVVWNRVNADGEVAELRFDGQTRVAVARELEREFGLRQLRERGQGRLNEREQAIATRYGKDPEEIKATIQDCYHNAENGQELQDHLAAHDMLLAKGNRRDFLVVDEDGIYYALGRVTDEKAKAVREKLADLDREALPSLEDAREQQRDRRALAIEAEMKNELLHSGVVLVDIAPEERAAAREEHEQAIGDYDEHRYNERTATIAEGYEKPVDAEREIGRTADRAADVLGKGLDIGANAAVAIADKAVDVFAEVLDLFAGSTNTQQRTATPERQQGKKHERTPEPKPEKQDAAPKREETAAEMRRRLMAEAEKILEQERTRDLTEERTRSRRRGR